MANQGTLLTISAPSGAGKTSLVHALLERDPAIAVSVSHTTRAKRSGEQEGVNYHFVDEASFHNMIAESAFLEHASVFGNFYGTSTQWVKDTLSRGIDVILEIDWQGAKQVKRLLPDTRSIFIIPPSKKTLEERLQGRGQDSQSVIDNRMREAINEMSHYVDADWLIVNDNFDQALNELHGIVRASRCAIERAQNTHQQLLSDLLS